jgi:hypothetical protein
MSEIPEIRSIGIPIKNVKIIEIPEWNSSIPRFYAPPVTVNIGVPIVDIPGCVEVHKTNNPKNNEIKKDDSSGNYTVCDSSLPSYNPINYEPEQMIITSPAPIPQNNTETPKPEVPKTPETPAPPAANTAKIDCPTPAQEAKEPVGTLVEGFRKKVVAYELVGNECIQRTEKVPLPQQIVAGLPSGGQVVQVGGVAVIATTSALLAKPLADILLKAVKPVVKKVMKKIAQIRKKSIPVKSSGERRAEQRQMNHAVRELRSVFPRRKKKRKG